MKVFIVLLVAASASAQSGIKFGDQVQKAAADIGTRLGLLGTQLGLNPIAENGQNSQNSNSGLTQGSGSGSQTGAFTQGSSGQTPTGRVPSGGEFTGSFDQCCCVPLAEECGDPLGRDLDYDYDFVGSGLIDPRLKPLQEAAAAATPKANAGLGLRIVNRPQANTNSQQNTCPSGQKACCYDSSVDHSSFGRSCVSPSGAQSLERISYGCGERPVSSSVKQCGTRQYSRPASGLQHGESSPGEFPWTCLVLNSNNDFVGSCAIIPDDSSNNNGAGTRKVVTAAHKLKNVQANELLKIRVGEYDASGFNPPETTNHDEYTVVRLLKHPQFDARRLSNDIAILYTQNPINLNKPHVNTACLPSCKDQFSHTFNNGTGLRCWVAGWGKNEVDGSFQFIQHKVDLPLVQSNSCNSRLKSALNRQRPNSGNRFTLSDSEICAGGQVGKDACTGDGGSPLVCQAQSGRWTVVGLVTWGVGCASDVPGVYARISHFIQWINQN